MKDNKLIAEFMGMTYEEDYDAWYDNEMMLEQIVYDLNDGNCFDELYFHTSWNWLIPVVSKCFKNGQSWGDDTHQWDNIMDTMFTCDISIVYAQVVEFIKKYNHGRM